MPSELEIYPCSGLNIFSTLHMVFPYQPMEAESSSGLRKVCWQNSHQLFGISQEIQEISSMGAGRNLLEPLPPPASSPFSFFFTLVIIMFHSSETLAAAVAVVHRPLQRAGVRAEVAGGREERSGVCWPSKVAHPVPLAGTQLLMVGSVDSAIKVYVHVSVQSSELGPPPPPHTQAIVAPPFWVQGRRHTCLRGRGWADPIRTTGQKLWCSVL